MATRSATHSTNVTGLSILCAKPTGTASLFAKTLAQRSNLSGDVGTLAGGLAANAVCAFTRP